jgi:DNA-binding response OmpR family regulator
MQLRVLIVDDSRIMRNMMIRLLDRSGVGSFQFIEARDGYLAQRVLDDESVDLVLIDGSTPSTNCLDFVRQVRARHVPVIVVTDGIWPGAVEPAFLRAGVSAFFRKPFDRDEVAQRLRAVIAGIAISQARARSSWWSLVRSWIGSHLPPLDRLAGRESVWQSSSKVR